MHLADCRRPLRRIGRIPLSIFRHGEFKPRLEAARPRLYRAAFVWTHHREIAEDLVHETVSKALRKGRQLRDINAIDAWLFRIMTNCWRDYLRQQPATDPIESVELEDHRSPEFETGRLEVISQVRTAVARLPESFRQTVTLVDIEGFSYMEAAQILNVPAGTIMSRLSRARHRLRETLTVDLERHATSASPHSIRRVK